METEVGWQSSFRPLLGSYGGETRYGSKHFLNY